MDHSSYSSFLDMTTEQQKVAFQSKMPFIPLKKKLRDEEKKYTREEMDLVTKQLHYDQAEIRQKSDTNSVYRSLLWDFNDCASNKKRQLPVY